VNWEDRNFGNKILFIIYRFIRGYYISIYFYFFPFLSLIMSYLSQRCSDVDKVNQTDSIKQGNVVTGKMCTMNLPLNYAL